MPTKKPKVLITFDKQLLNRVDDFRFENRINTRSEAIRRLIDEGLKKHEKNPKNNT
jgi:metal-responsive CopG/Arc/MetJ family transcriptional regulator